MLRHTNSRAPLRSSALLPIGIDMRRTAVHALIILACVVGVNCGGSDSSGPAPSTGAVGSSSGGGGSTGGDTVRNVSDITDTAFDDNDWDDVIDTNGVSGTGAGAHLRFNGQVGADYRQVTIRINSSEPDAKVALFAIRRRDAYSPSSDGAILSIDYSESSINQSGNVQYSAPAIRQNGKIYTLMPGSGAFAAAETSWTDHSLAHLTQNDFRTMASASEHPDFSRSGTRIEFGFLRMQIGPGDSKAGIDNYRMVLYRN